MLVVAHGEKWEVAASRAVSKLVKKILEEQNGNEQPQENGTFALQYTPSDLTRKTVTVPIETPNTIRQNRPDYSIDNYGQQNTNLYSIIRF